MHKETYVIHVTKECNLNCKYCYEQDKTSTYSKSEIKKIIDDIINNSPQEFSIEFLGGEPMLGWDNIKFAVEYFKEFNKKVSFAITTNGAIIDDEKIKFILDNNIVWAISVDGPGIAGSLRPYKDGSQSFKDVMDNIRYAQERGLQASVHIVNHLYNVAYLYDSVKYFYSKGIRWIAAGIVESTMQIDDDFCNRYASEMRKISDDESLKDLHVSELEGLKPVSDVRTYIKDAEGKVVLESYGRVKEDLTKDEDLNYEVIRIEEPSETSQRINALRSYVYHYHQNKKT